MELKDSECEVLIQKYNFLGYSRKKLEERLQMLDPNISLNILRLTLSHPDF